VIDLLHWCCQTINNDIVDNCSDVIINPILPIVYSFCVGAVYVCPRVIARNGLDM